MADLLPVATLRVATMVPYAAPGETPIAGLDAGPCASDPFADLLALVVGTGSGAGPALPLPAPVAELAPVAAAPELAAAVAPDEVVMVSPERPEDEAARGEAQAAELLTLFVPPPSPPVAAPLPVAASPAPMMTPPSAEASAASTRTAAAPVAPPTPQPLAAASDDAPATPQTEDGAEPDSPPAPTAERVVSAGREQARPVVQATLPAAILHLLNEAPAAATPPPPAAVAAAAPQTVAPAAVRPAQPQAARVAETAALARRAPAAQAAPGTRPPRDEHPLREMPQQQQQQAEPLPFGFAQVAPVDPAVAATQRPADAPAAALDPLVERQLAVAEDGKWLDALARDIAGTASGRDLHFRLNPEHLGALTVRLIAEAEGTTIRMTADTERAREVLTEAQPRLIAEARAQGLKVNEAHVELRDNGSSSTQTGWTQAGTGHGQGQNAPGGQPQDDRRAQTSSPNRLPLSASGDGEPAEQSARVRSERYA